MKIELTIDELQYIEDLVMLDIVDANKQHEDSIILKLLFKLDAHISSAL
jgi:hypothetical protein